MRWLEEMDLVVVSDVMFEVSGSVNLSVIDRRYFHFRIGQYLIEGLSCE